MSGGHGRVLREAQGCPQGGRNGRVPAGLGGGVQMDALQGSLVEVDGVRPLHEVQARQVLPAGVAGVDVLPRRPGHGKAVQGFVVLIVAAGTCQPHEAPAMRADRAVVPDLAALGEEKF